MDRWKSPIDLQMFEESFATKILEDQTGCVIETCVKMGVNVDKDELIKALSYDRDQYEKGYSDGRMARDDEIVRCKDCKWFVDEGMYCENNFIPQFNHFFCYYGERREDAEIS